MKLTAAKIGKIKIAVTATILSLAVIAAVTIVCESFGVFPGAYCNRIAVSYYMNKAHKGVEYTVLSQSFEESEESKYGTVSKEKFYVYECRIDNTADKGEKFEIHAYGMKVISDGYNKNYVRSKAVEYKINEWVSDDIKKAYDVAYPESKTDMFDVECEAVLTKEKYGVSIDDKAVEDVVNSLKDNFAITVYLKGEKIDFSLYKKIAAQVVDVIYTKEKYEPAIIQILYYRDIAEGEVVNKNEVIKDDKILSYESRIDYYALSFNIESASGMHFYVELSDKDYQKFKIYTIFKYIYIVFVTIVVIVLLTLWTVRKFKKWSKEGKNSKVYNDISTVL